MKRYVALAVFATALTLPAFAQLDGARVNVPLPKNTNLVGGTFYGGTANASWSAFNNVQGNFDIDSSVYALSYTRSSLSLDAPLTGQQFCPPGRSGRTRRSQSRPPMPTPTDWATSLSVAQ